MYNCNHWTLQ